MKDKRGLLRKRMLALLTMAGALIVVGLTTVAFAVVTDSGTVDVRVPSGDNTTSVVDEPTNNGAWVSYFGDQDTTFGSSGTGTFDPFVRLQQGGSESGYNTNGTLEPDTKGGKWTHAIKVSHIPQRPCPGGTCFELFNDINESNAQQNAKGRISLNEVEVYYTTDPDLTGYPFVGSATLEYDFAGDILIDDVNQGSGRGDLRYLIQIGAGGVDLPPDCDYGNPACDTYFVLYSEWGTTATGTAPFDDDWTTDGGFEEWKVKIYPAISLTKTPDPTEVCNGLDTEVTYTYVVTNNSPGGDSVDGTVVDDNGTPAVPGDDFTVGTFSSLDAGDSETFTHVVTVSGTRTNIATATATDPDGETATATAEATVTGVDCDIEIDKSVDPDTVCNGLTTTVTYTFKVWNPGDVDLTNVTLTDTTLSDAAVQAAFETANGGSDTLSTANGTIGTAVVFSVDVDLTGSQTNTVTVTGDALGNTPADSDSSSATVTGVDCDIEIDKSVDPDTVCNGLTTTVTYTFKVWNPGDVDLTNVTLTDTTLSDAAVQAAFETANGGSDTLSTANGTIGTAVVFSVDVDLTGSQTNTVTVTGDALGNTPADSDSSSATVTGVDCDIEIDKSVDPDTVCNGLTTTVTYTFKVWNPGDVDLTNVTLTDTTLSDAAVQAAFETANGGSDTLSTANGTIGTAVVFSVDVDLTGSQTNTVTVTGDALGNTPADSDSSSATVTGVDCDIEIDKSVDPDTVCNGLTTTVTYTFKVWNPGDVDLTNVTLTDTTLSDAAVQAAFETANGGSDTLSTANGTIGTAVVFSVDVDLTGSQTNTVTVTGDALGNTPADSDSSSATVTGVDCDIEIDKSVDPDTVCNGLTTTVTYTFKVWNPGDVDLTNVTLTDTTLSDAAVQAAFETANGGSDTLSTANGTIGTAVVFSVDVDLTGSQTNTVTVTGDALGNTPADSDSSSATVTGVDCDIEIDKSVDPDTVCNGLTTTVTYTFKVWNPGDVDLTNVTLTDTTLSDAAVQAAFETANGGSDTLSTANGTIGTAVVFSVDVDLTGSQTNTVTVTGDALGNTPADSDSSSATVTGVDCDIEIDKSVDPDTVCNGLTTTVTYTFKVWNPGDVDLTNVTLTDTTLSDAAVQAAFETANGGSDTLSTANGTIGTAVVFSVDVDLTGSQTNTVTVTGDALGNTPADSDSSSATVTGVDCDIEIDKSVDPDTVCNGLTTTVTYTFKVWNPGDVDLTNVTLTDTTLSDAAVQAAFETANGGSDTLSTANGTIGTAVVFSVDVDLTGSQTNTVTVTGDALGNTPADSDSSSATVTAETCAQITPTNVDCDIFSSGTAPSLSEIEYSLKDGVINQTNPGVFFYWVNVSGPGPFIINQSNDGGLPHFARASGAFAFGSDCNPISGATIVQDASGNVTITGSGIAVLGVKYSTGTVKGELAPNPNTVEYTFKLAGDPTSAQSIDLVLK